MLTNEEIIEKTGITKERLKEIQEEFPPYDKSIGSSYKDKTGEKIGALFVMYRGQNKSGRSAVVCLCDCGKVKHIIQNDLQQNKIVSCGCGLGRNKGKYPTNLTGLKIGSWTVLNHSDYIDAVNRCRYWDCVCDCGTKKRVRDDYLRYGQSVSCGCSFGEWQEEDLTGRRFGLVTAIRKAPEHKDILDSSNSMPWLCKCDCGNTCCITRNRLLKAPGGCSCGCENHSKSINEELIESMLKAENISFETQKTFKELGMFRFDFFVNNEYIIEYDGGQHFREVSHWGALEDTRNHDLIKNKYCFDNSIPLIRIPCDVEYTIDDLKLETTRFLLTPENEKEYYESRK